ncbi:hypothetical protein RSOL_434450 [Rhizoctonia solani AG-3 Rhs1AP]|uniref:Uncharacterized protein n=2 Tax=Rhizoctonia solani AG-3 TaxID=1086053 RepID=A0A074S567_9AGAM|nr:hypothetical protein RSOL_434450 [Rhizoctonia solani AG-3 Rhs1AP]KEP54379.1 hypothetical protein V565_018570 [Rhizoctonia solani 123E]
MHRVIQRWHLETTGFCYIWLRICSHSLTTSPSLDLTSNTTGQGTPLCCPGTTHLSYQYTSKLALATSSGFQTSLFYQYVLNLSVSTTAHLGGHFRQMRKPKL